MLNYKLTKQLEKAEFPFIASDAERKEYYIRTKIELDRPVIITFYNNDMDKKNYLYIPLLTELLTRCDDKLQLQSYYDKTGLRMWKADNKEGFISEISRIPENAVARYWLKLNKSK